MQNITDESDLNDLTILGQPAQPGRTLEIFPNHHPARDYMVTLATNEFTCLCPKTGQPDFAKIIITYIPDKSLVESKSLKLYLASFRNEGAFHEHVTNTILDDLKKAMAPRWCKVTAEFAVRGGISITVNAEYGKALVTPAVPVSTPVRTAEKTNREEPEMIDKSRFPAASPRWERGRDKKPLEWEQKTRSRPNYGKAPEENRFERVKSKRIEGDTRPYKRAEGPAKIEEKPNWERKKSERRTTKSLGETRTWRKRT